MHDVERPVSQGFDGRPLAAVPQPVQQSDRHTAVNPSDRRREWRGEAVFPGTAEDRDLQPVGLPTLGERLNQSRHPESHACSMTERRADSR